MTALRDKNVVLLRIVQGVWYLLSLIEVVLLLRFLLKLFGANPNAGFSTFIYGISYPLVAPFQAVFPNTAANANVFEWTTLLAMLVYWLFVYLIVKLFVMQKPVSRFEAKEELDREE